MQYTKKKAIAQIEVSPMASPQPTDSHTRISNELYTEILMRDFTKRQRAILDLIIRLSYGCGKKTAYIPTLKYFDVCGVHPKKATSELRTLKELNVILWDNLTKLYWFNKDYDTWLIHHNSQDSKEHFNELLKLNLQYHQNGDTYPQNGDVYPQNRDTDIPKTGANLPPKRGREIPETPCPVPLNEVPITKNSYKEIKNINNNKIMDAMKILSKLFPYGVSEAIRYDINQYIGDGLEPEMLNIAYNIADGKDPGQKASYMKGILRGFMNSEIKTVSQYELQLAERESATPKQGGKSDVRKPTSRYSNETDEEWAEFERNFYKQ